MRLAAILLALIAMTHYGYEPLASRYADPDQAGRILFYILRGIEGSALFLVCGILARHRLVWLVCAWGFAEESQTAVCQMATGVTIVDRTLYQGLCGSPMYTLGLIVAAGLAVHILDKGDKK